jgi:hypothetical protein
MKRMILAAFLSGCFLLSPGGKAQEKAKPAEPEKKPEYWKDSALLRVQMVFTEKDGEKKISSLPYQLVLHSNAPGRAAALRMGLRVPVSISTGQFQYMEIGTNLDGHAEKTEDGRFQLSFSIEKSSLYYPAADQKAASTNDSESSSDKTPKQPTIQKFQAEINVLIRDGQTLEAMTATDPITGHVLRVDVTLTVLK